MIILTGNDLKTGAVIWWTGSGWSLHINHAADAAEKAREITAREEAARRVNAPYAIEADWVDGKLRPAHIKDRVRALGPTVRPDLTLQPADPAAIDWVI